MRIEKEGKKIIENMVKQHETWLETKGKYGQRFHLKSTLLDMIEHGINMESIHIEDIHLKNVDLQYCLD